MRRKYRPAMPRSSSMLGGAIPSVYVPTRAKARRGAKPGNAPAPIEAATPAAIPIRNRSRRLSVEARERAFGRWAFCSLLLINPSSGLKRDFRLWSHSASHGGVHRADRPVSQLVHASRHVDGGASGKPWGLCDRVLLGSVTPTVPSRDSAAESPPVAHSRRSLYGPAYHVGCHASRLMRPRICRKRFRVNWLSASCRVKYRACRMRRPPVLNNRCWRLVRVTG